jgi:hypothetical protein
LTDVTEPKQKKGNSNYLSFNFLPELLVDESIFFTCISAPNGKTKAANWAVHRCLFNAVLITIQTKDMLAWEAHWLNKDALAYWALDILLRQRTLFLKL